MKIYRMHRRARQASDYTGAMLAGGRWNSIGTPMLYAAGHLSLALVEILVHLDKRQLPSDYGWSAADLDEAIWNVPVPQLDDLAACQAAGDSWMGNAECLAVQVPSVIVPQEFNVVLNPKHSGFSKIAWSQPRLFRFDPRLFTLEPEVL